MITINFASRNYRLISRIRIGLITACAVLALLMAVLTGTSVSLRADNAALDEKLKKLETVHAQVLPLQMERDRLVKEFSAMSGLLEARKFSWTRLLTKIETIVPKGAALKNVEYNPGVRSLKLEGIAHSPELLHNLVAGLEKSPSFKDPFLKHQSLEKGSISFNVVVVYRENAGAAAAQGAQ